MTATGRPGLLIVDDDELILSLLSAELADDFNIVGARERSEVAQSLLQLGEPPACALIDLGLPPHTDNPREGFALLRELVTTTPGCAVIVVSGQNEQEHGKLARTLGAIDYVAKPCDAETIRRALSRALSAQAAVSGETGLLGHSTPITSLQRQLRQFAPAPYPVLVEGESGTGKELAARALHAASARNGKFVALNCAALPEQLFESNLFGARRGAFTDATRDLPGHVATAQGGTLFLDEIGELPLTVQPKLLRLLENGEYQRVGDAEPQIADVRVIAATNRPLRQSVRTGSFREDLYHRLSVLVITMPALRELGDDRMILLEHFRAQATSHAGTPPFELDDDAQALWHRYSFPGNVRELRNIVTRLQIVHPGMTVDHATLNAELLDTSTRTNLDHLLDADARSHARAMRTQTGSDEQAASQLGISVTRLRELLADDDAAVD